MSVELVSLCGRNVESHEASRGRSLQFVLRLALCLLLLSIWSMLDRSALRMHADAIRVSGTPVGRSCDLFGVRLTAVLCKKTRNMHNITGRRCASSSSAARVGEEAA
eukprot:12770404-Alexandrium_andersonii.AAC.1